MAAGDCQADAIDMAERAVSRVVAVIESMCLRVAPHKTEAILFGGPLQTRRLSPP